MVFEYKFDIRTLLQYGIIIAQSNQRLTTGSPLPRIQAPAAVQLSVQPPCWLISTEAISYTLWLFNSSPWKNPPFFIGKPSINGPFSMAMLNNQRVIL